MSEISDRGFPTPSTPGDPDPVQTRPAVVVDVTELHAEYRRDGSPFIATARPRLSWRTETDTPGWRQTAAELRVSRPDGVASHRFDGSESVLVDWPFHELGTRERADVEVRVWGPGGTPSDWSAPIAVECAALPLAQWHARL